MSTTRVIGIVRGREINSSAEVSVDHDALLLAWSDAPSWRLGWSGIDGVTYTPTSITVYLATHDVLELSGDDALRALAVRALDAAFAMPEVTRGLRSLGSTRGDPGDAHDRWFAPLLAARRAATSVSDPARQVALFDHRALRAEMLQAISDIAVAHIQGDEPAQRALEAALEEEAESLFLALQLMGVAGDALLGGAADTRLADWRRWVATVKAVFAATDESWGRARTLLSSR